VEGRPRSKLPKPADPAHDCDAQCDYERCAALINRTHAGRDLFRAYTAEWLRDRLEHDVPQGAPWQPAYALPDFQVLERGGAVVACPGLWDRGRDVREHWTHRWTGQERIVSNTALLDIGFAEGHEDAMTGLIEHLLGETHELGRDYLTAPLATCPASRRASRGSSRRRRRAISTGGRTRPR
jgi:hypothetical protein